RIVYFPLGHVSNDGPLPVTCRERCRAAPLTAADRRVTMKRSREGSIEGSSEGGEHAADRRGGWWGGGGFGGLWWGGAPAGRGCGGVWANLLSAQPWGCWWAARETIRRLPPGEQELKFVS